MDYKKETIAKLFSNGEFESVFKYLSENIVWDIVGEIILTDKNDVIEHCQKTLIYLESLETEFATDELITSENKVIITGTAKFIKDGKYVNIISACDIYEFYGDNKIKSISSYCIPISFQKYYQIL